MASSRLVQGRAWAKPGTSGDGGAGAGGQYTKNIDGVALTGDKMAALLKG